MDGTVGLRVTRKERLASGVVGLRLEHPDGRRLPDWTPGAHIDLVLPNGMTRQYSLCGDRWDAHSYRIAVLREDGGRGGSVHVHDELTEGALVRIGGPRNNFGLAPANRYLFIAGGIGITPLLPMLAAAERLDADWRLLYGGRSRDSMALLDELATYGEKVSVAPQDECGLLDLPAWLPEPDDGSKVYCCGPAPLLDAVARACADWPAGSVRTERFVAERVADVEDRSFRVELARSGRSVTVGADVSILDAVRDAGASVLSSCGQGLCGTCETGVFRGEPEHRDAILDDAERARADCMFICVSRSRSERLVLDL
ncbi:PDR/VanB family oxidoreductase [Saccharopolyspora halophila]|uniref:PDR/VanB family oxidoreductase n=1 Tax=Saccharopolyspora halophila TaxID=405551 RepID=A0ABP5TGB1_9PSEU